MAEEKDREGTEAIVAEFHKKIKEAFEVFDHETNNTVDVRLLCELVLITTAMEELLNFARTDSPCQLSEVTVFLSIRDLCAEASRRATREIGTIIRSLGCYPTEGELHDFIAEVEEEEPTGYIRYEKFLPVMTRVLLERKYRPIAEDLLLRAFEVLDSAKRGFLTKEELVKYMTEEGEPFSQEEMEEMLSAAIDPESNSINYRDYITMMVIDEN